jgi:tripartite-type tricarboxylate transporter receptor subunit TctC
MSESGYPQLNPSWTAVFVPAETPAAVVQRLNDAINQVIATPDYKEKIANQAMVASPASNTRQLADYIKGEVQLWNRIVKTTGAKPE